MNRIIFKILFLLIFLLHFSYAEQGKHLPKATKPEYEKLLDTRIDNIGYWTQLAEQGYVVMAPKRDVEPPVYLSPIIDSKSVYTSYSPDILVENKTEELFKEKKKNKTLNIAVTTANVTQSENSIFVNPTNNDYIINSNNSDPVSGLSFYGADFFKSINTGSSWTGQVEGTRGSNRGDPSVVIGTNGWLYVGFINSTSGQSIARSTNNGTDWSVYQVAARGSSTILDKNHLWIDNSSSSSFEGNLYNAWTPFGGSNSSQIVLSRSTNDGQNWSTPINISSNVNAGNLNHGVNINSGPNGEVYAVWSIYDSWPTDENAIGFAKSTNGGASFLSAQRIIQNIRGIRNTETYKNMRVNSFPCMAVDISGGDNNGNIYVVWANIGTPGVNTGTRINIYLIKSTNGGTSWSSPIVINQNPANITKQSFFPWITCDPETGNLSVVFYDDRNTISTKCETWVANSIDGGVTWNDFRVSDVSFTPSPITGLADGYFGDYIGISARGGIVYPCWTDNRSGRALTYVSPLELSLPDDPCSSKLLTINANASINDNTFASNSSGISAPGCGNYNGKDLWFRAVVPSNCKITFEGGEVSGGFADGAMALYSGSTCSSLTLVQCNDNSGPGNMPKITLTSRTSGESLYARFWENGGDQSGKFSIRVYSPPLNDDPCNATLLTINNDMSSANNTAATNSTGVSAPGCGNYNGKDVWFKAVVPSTGQIIIDTYSDAFGITDGAIAAYSGTCSSLSLITCNDNNDSDLMPSLDLSGRTVGETIYIRFWENGGDVEGNFGIRVWDGVPVYCDAGSDQCDEYISRVVVGSFDNNNNSCSGNAYSDYTVLSTTMEPGLSYNVTVYNGNPYFADRCGIWIDWNTDGDFSDANETLSVSGYPGFGPYSATITPSVSTSSGNKRLRIRINWNNTLSPCGNDWYGEVEDYTIFVDGCQNDLSPSSYDGNTTLFKASNSIIAGGGSNTFIIPGTNNVHFVAGNSIKLLPGFKANNGCDFHGLLVNDPCNYSLSRIPQISENGLDIPNDEVLNNTLPETGELKIYPNPAHEYITVRLPKSDEKCLYVEIVTLISEKVIREYPEYKIFNIDLKDISAGIYIIRAVYENRVFMQKLIVE